MKSSGKRCPRDSVTHSTAKRNVAALLLCMTIPLALLIQTRVGAVHRTDGADVHAGVAQHAQRRRAARRQPRVQQLRDQRGVEDEHKACGGATDRQMSVCWSQKWQSRRLPCGSMLQSGAEATSLEHERWFRRGGAGPQGHCRIPLTDDEVGHALELQEPRRPGHTLRCRLPEGPGNLVEAGRRRCATCCHCNCARRSPRGGGHKRQIGRRLQTRLETRADYADLCLVGVCSLLISSHHAPGMYEPILCPSITASLRVLTSIAVHSISSLPACDRTGTQILQGPRRGKLVERVRIDIANV